MNSYEALCSRLSAVDDLQKAAALLEWDRETHMPIGGVAARARQLATLRTLAHERFTDDRIGALLEAAAGGVPDACGEDLLDVVRRDYVRARRVPKRLVHDLTMAVGHAEAAWRRARTANDFAVFAGHLERIIALNIEKAEALGYDECRYDALLEEYEPGMRTAAVRALFSSLQAELIPMVREIAQCEPPDAAFLHQPYDVDGQWAFGMEVLQAIGYDFMRGRQDTSVHPFSTAFSIDDVRITTRLDPHNVTSGIFSSLHEAGHALYEQGLDPALENTPLADGTSLGMHESQSRLWENQIGRSRPFWEHFYARLQAHFPSQLSSVSLDAFYRAVNRVEPSCIRVEADEVTYNLHILLQFELEEQLIAEQMGARDLPTAWNEQMQAFLGVCPSNDVEGVLQDIHWAMGAIGYFPTYTLGNLMSAQIFACAQAALPDLNRSAARGDFTDLLAWLRTHFHQYGRRRSAAALMAQFTGEVLSAAPWLAYVRNKYGVLYPIQH